MKEYVTFEVDYLTDTYSYAREQYKNAIGDRDKDYWEGYLDALDTVYKGDISRQVFDHHKEIRAYPHDQ